MLDFPHVVERYNTPDDAITSVKQVVEQSKRVRLHAFAIEYNGEVIGAATLWKNALWPAGFVGLIAKLGRRPIVNGVQFAFWLARKGQRNGAPDDIAARVIEALVARTDKLWPRAQMWTLVRPNHPRTPTLLKGAGLVVISELDAEYVDGVSGLRYVYVRAPQDKTV